MATTEGYKRGQVEWALWRYFRQLPTEHRTPPNVFRTRIKRLLELDGVVDNGAAGAAPAAPHAFFDVPPEGQGVDVPYTSFNAFCLALGLDLLDTGFKQSEVVFLLRNLRHFLEKEFSGILECPPSPRQRTSAQERPHCPTYEERGHLYADCRVFMLINKVEIKEVFSSPEDSRFKKLPLILEPTICHGIEDLRKELHHMNYSFRKALVVELAYTAAMVADLLEKAPVVKRGPK